MDIQKKIGNRKTPGWFGSLILICLMFFSTKALAINLCGSEYNRPDYGLKVENSDLSHDIFNEQRWRCAVPTAFGANYTGFAHFTIAAALCGSEAKGSFWTSEIKDRLPASEVIDLLAKSLDLAGTLDRDEEEEFACFLGIHPGWARRDSFVGIYHYTPTPVGHRLISGVYDTGEEVKEAVFIPWLMKERITAVPTVFYLPEFEASRCFDPVCGAGSTASVQYGKVPIEPGHGTIDISLPILSAEFPGLLPVSLHYSSWMTVKKTQSHSLERWNSDREQLEEEEEVGAYWHRSWHHSFDRRLVEDFYGEAGDSQLRLNLHLSSEDILIFEKQGANFVCVSHPGVTSTFHQVGEFEYELRRPDGYVEVYEDQFLKKIIYPDSRTITLTDSIQFSPFVRRLTIEQDHPPVGAVIERDIMENVLSISSLNNPEYRFTLNYKDYGHPIHQQLSSITRPDGASIVIDQKPLPNILIDYASFLLTGISINNNRLLDITYAGDGRATAVRYLSGEEYTAEYSGSSRMVASGPYGAEYDIGISEQPVGRSPYLGLISMPSISSVKCTNCGYTESFEYNGDGLISQISRSGNRSFTSTFSADGLLTSLDEGGLLTELTWDSTHKRITGVTGSEVLASSIAYSNGKVSSITSSGSDSERKVSVENRDGNITGISGVHNDQLSVKYNDDGFITDVSNRMGHTYRFESHNHFGQPGVITDPNGVRTDLDYDVMGQLLRYSRSDGESLALSYNALGLPVSATVGSEKIDFNYDSRQRLSSVEGECSPGWHYEYTDSGLLSSVSQRHNGVQRVTRYEYDVEGYLTRSVVVQGDHHISTEYDERGQVSAVSEGENQVQFVRDERGRLVGTRVNEADEATFSLSSLGRVVEITASGDQTTTFSYTGLGQLASQENPNWGAREYTYSDAGHLATRSTPQFVTNYEFDLIDRPSSIVHRRKNSTFEIAVHFAYDGVSAASSPDNQIGHLTGVDNGFGRYQYQYTATGEVQQQTISISGNAAGPVDISYRHDSSNRLSRIIYPNGSQLSYELEPCSGELVALHWNDRQIATLNGSSQLQAYNGATLDSGLMVQRTFDERNRLTGISLQNARRSVWQESYTYEGNGNLGAVVTSTEEFDVGGNQSFTYDSSNRVLTASGHYGDLIYAYDRFGHRTSKTNDGQITHYRYVTGSDQVAARIDANGEVLEEYGYDSDGNRTRAGDWQYQYNAAGRLSQVHKSGQWVASYTYDANGKRISKESIDGHFFFYYDKHGRLLQETTADGAVLRQYLYTDLGELFAIVDEHGHIYFVHSDHLGAPRLLTSESGEVVWSAKRTPFGKTEVTFAAVDFPIRLPGQYYDKETGLHYNQQRYYDPDTGQYLRPDPLGVAGGYHLYSYTNHNPTTYVDPEGEVLFLAAIPWVITGVSAALTAWEVYDTVDGLASGRVTKEDLAAGYAQDKAISIGLKAVPGVGAAASIAYGAAKRSKLDKVGGEVANRGAYGHKANTGLKKQLKSEAQLADINNGGGVPTHGAGAPRKLDVAGRLEKQYGGNASDWQKVSSDAYKSTDGGHVEIHAYRNVRTGQVVEPKSIVNPQVKGFQ